MAADGRILIDSRINTEGILAGEDEIIASARRMAKTTEGLSNSVRNSFENQANSLQKSARLYTEQEQKVESLRRKLEELRAERIPTEAYRTLEAEIKKNESALDKLIEKQIRFVEIGGKTKSRAFEAMEYDIEQVSRKLEELRARRAAMETDDTAFIAGGATEEAAKTAERLAREEQRLQEMHRSLGTSYEQLQRRVQEYTERLAEEARQAEKTARKETESTERTTRAMGRKNVGFGASLSMILKYGLGIRSLYALVNKLRTAIVAGFKNLSQYSDNTNKALSGLMSALTQCKNALATAFSPILQIIAPALIYLINLVTMAATAVAQLIAALSGQKSFVKAKKVQQDYAKSLKKTGQAAKDAEGSLAAFDKLNVQANKNAGGGGGAGEELSPSDMFETVPVTNSLTEAIDAVKKKVQELMQISKKGFFEGVGDLAVLNSIKKSVSDIKTSFSDIFKNKDVVNAANNMVNTLAYDLGRISGSLVSVGLTFADNLLGGFSRYLSENSPRIQQYLISMFDITSQISTIAGDFAEATAEIFSVFRGDTAKQITADIIAIFVNSFMTITELCGKLFRDILNVILTPFTENAGKIAESIEGLLGPTEEILGTLADSVTETLDEINKMYDEHIAPLFDDFAKGLSDILSQAIDSWNRYMKPTLDELAAKFSEVWKGTVQPTINSFIDLIGSAMDVVSAFWHNILEPLIAWTQSHILPILTPILETIGKIFLDTFDAVTKVLKVFLDVLKLVLDFIANVFKGDWSAAWNSIKEAFNVAFSSIPNIVNTTVKRIVNIIEDLINGVLDGIGNMLDIAADIPIVGKAVPNWRPKNVKIPLPGLASGTVVPPRAGEFAAILGDNKRETEVVSPLSTMKQAMIEAMREAGFSGNRNGEINLSINLDGRQIYKAVVDMNRANTKMTGRNAFVT